jgi:hypothetical protein
MGMYDISAVPQDAQLWQLIALCAGTSIWLPPALSLHAVEMQRGLLSSTLCCCNLCYVIACAADARTAT